MASTMTTIAFMLMSALAANAANLRSNGSATVVPLGCNEKMFGTKDAAYRGCQTKTKTGRTCQAWSTNTPHAHSNSCAQKPAGGVCNQQSPNNCRNPDSSDSIWCYTTSSTRWEYCDPLRTTVAEAMHEKLACYEKMLGSKDADYRGCQTKTKTGRTCQAWSTNTPHAHGNSCAQKPTGGVCNQQSPNNCRNPDNSDSIWCYTTSSTRWEYCDPLPSASSCIAAPAPDTSSFSCGTGWTLYTGVGAHGATGHCYQRQTTKVWFDAARTVCAGMGHPDNPLTVKDNRTGARFPSLGSYLAVPNSAAENTFLTTVMNPSAEAYSWIGFDSFKPGDKWEDMSAGNSTDCWRKLLNNNAVVTDSVDRLAQPVIFMRATGAWSFDPKAYNMEFVCEAEAWNNSPGSLHANP